jgi:hypothetical protein
MSFILLTFKVYQAVLPKQLTGLGLKGNEFGEALRSKRVDAIGDLKKTYVSDSVEN